MSSDTTSSPTSYGIALFPGFQALDVFGPLEILNQLANSTALKLAVLSHDLEPVSTKTLAQNAIGSDFHERIVPTHTFDNPPEDLEVLLVPGGRGTRDEEVIAPAIKFIKAAYPTLRYLITVCSGSVVVAKTGHLDGRKATTNKAWWDWVSSVTWVPQARWVVDGNIWTSSGVSAGIDVTLAFVATRYGEDRAQSIADAAEYVRNKDPDHDPFGKTFNVT